MKYEEILKCRSVGEYCSGRKCEECLVKKERTIDLYENCEDAFKRIQRKAKLEKMLYGK